MSQPSETNELSNHSGRSVEEEEENSSMPEEEFNFLSSREIEEEEIQGTPSPSSVEPFETSPVLFSSPSPTSPASSLEPSSSWEEASVLVDGVPSVLLPPRMEETNASAEKTVVAEEFHEAHPAIAPPEVLATSPPAPTGMVVSPTVLHPSALGTHEEEHPSTGRPFEAAPHLEVSPPLLHKAVEDDADASFVSHADALPPPSSSTLEKVAFAVSEFQMMLHDSVISTTLESSAAALAQTLQQLLWMRESERDTLREEQERKESTLCGYREAMASLTAEACRERERHAEPVPLRDGHSLEAVEEGGEGHTVEGSSAGVKEKLFADYAHATGRVELLEQDVRHTRGVNQQLRRLLKDVVEENNTLREQLTLLQVSTVARTDYDEEVRQHQTVKHELESVKVEVQSMEVMYQEVWQQHESLLQEQEVVIQQYKQQLDKQRERDGVLSDTAEEMAPSTREQERDTKGTVGGGDNASSYAGASSAAFLWSKAVKQVEERAQQVVADDQIRKECFALKAAVVALECAKTEEIELRIEREKEVQRLSLDSQALLFRNQVLSHQLASLLEKVEQLERRHRVFVHGAEPMEDEKHMENDERQAEASPMWSTTSPPVNTESAPRTSSSVRTGGGAAAAAMAFTLLQERTAGSNGHRGASSSSKERQMYQTPSSIDEEAEKRHPKDVGQRSARLHSAHLGGSIASLMYTAPLDTPLEVSATLTQQLSAFTPSSRAALGRTKCYPLRRLCLSDAAEKEKKDPCAMQKGEDAVAFPIRVPRADLLSGVAWNHPPSYAVVDPWRGTMETRNGKACTPPNLLDVAGVEEGSCVPPPFVDVEKEEEEAHDVSHRPGDGNGNPETAPCDRRDNMDRVGSTVPSSLDRYTVHSIESLVQRNQELLSQLYRVTQEAAHRCPPSPSRPLPHASVQEASGLACRSTSTSRESSPSRTHRVPGTTPDNTHSDVDRLSGAVPTGVGMPRMDPSEARESSRRDPEKTVEVEKQILDVALADHLRQWQEKHDHLLSTHLLEVLKEAQAPLSPSWKGGAAGRASAAAEGTTTPSSLPHPSDDAVHTEESGGTAPLRTSPVVLALVDLCCSQAVQIATLTVPPPPPSIPSPSTALRSGGKGATAIGVETDVSNARTAVLQRFLATLTATLVHTVRDAQDEAAHGRKVAYESPTDIRAMRGSGGHHPFSPSSSEVPNATEGEGTVDPAQVDLLQHVLQLLQAASRKEDLLQQVLRYSDGQKKPLGALLDGTRHGKKTRKKMKKSAAKKKARRGAMASEGEAALAETSGPPRHPSRTGGKKRSRPHDDEETNARLASPDTRVWHAFSSSSPSPPASASSPTSPEGHLVPPLLLFPSRGADSPLSPMSPLPPSTAVDLNGFPSLFPSRVVRREENGVMEPQSLVSAVPPVLSPSLTSSPPPENGARPTSCTPHAFAEPRQQQQKMANADEEEASEGEEEEESEEEEDEEEESEEEEAVRWEKYGGVSTHASSPGRHAALEEQLAFQQAQRQQLLAELEEEKGKHIALLENIWKVEWERDTAMKEVKKGQESLSNMIASDVHQLALTKLAEGEQLLAACQSQLADTEGVVRALRQQLDAASEKSREDERHHASCVRALETALCAKQTEVDVLEGKMAALEAEEKVLQGECVRWQERSAKQNTMAESLESQVRGMEGKMHRLQIEFLSRPQVQEMLSEMLSVCVPQDGEDKGAEAVRVVAGEEKEWRAAPSTVSSSFLAPHTLNQQLIRDMRAERDKLTKHVTHNQLYIQRLEDKISQQNQLLQESQQQQQMTQLQLLLQWQTCSSGEKSHGEQREEGDGSPAMSEAHATFPTLSSTAIPPSSLVGDGSVPHASGYAVGRIRELEGDVAYLRQEVHMLENRERGFKEREATLRAELEIMSKDPVSENARRYGLRGCQSLMEQCAATQAQNTALQEMAAALRRSGEDSDAKVAAVTEEIQKVEKDKTAIEAQLRMVTDQLSMITQEKANLSTSLSTAQETLSTKEAEALAFTTELEKRQQAEQEAHAKVEKLRHDNLQLIAQVEQLLKDFQDTAEREKGLRRDLFQKECTLRQVREEADVAVAEARKLSSMCASSQGGMSGWVRKTSGSSAQQRLRAFPVSVTHKLRDDLSSSGGNGTP